MYENEKIKLIRDKLKLTQQEVADQLGVSKQYLSKVETGQTELSKEKMKLFCDTYNVSFDWMFGAGPNMFRPADEYMERLFYYDNGSEYFRSIIKDYNIFIKYIKEFIEKKHPDATFENKLNTAYEIFSNNFCRGKVSLSVDNTKAWIEDKMSDKFFQQEILTVYYTFCKMDKYLL